MSEPGPKTFIHDLIDRDLESGKYSGRVTTRFPPEPNGYLHIGHAKSICLGFGLAERYDGRCHLRFDDTNPSTEDPEYVESIQDDIRWLGFDWSPHLYFASDYFERLYQFAIELIEKELAYVDSSSEEEIRSLRGTVTEPGTASPHRNRSVAENLDLFQRMRAGEFEDGAHVLRAKIDMNAANMKMRDPLLYRIRHAHHYRTENDWPIYPMYDFAHCLSDSIESITHSLCTLEFENNRDIYDWILEHVDVDRPAPEQTEFARLALSYTVLSKRKLLELVQDGHVDGWDDPRMPTISGFRRRGYTPEAICAFCDTIGVAKANSVVDVAQLEHAIRDDLNQKAPRVLAVLRPLRLVVENYPEGKVERIEAPYYPHDVPKEGSRELPFSRELYIEKNDFLEDPPGKYRRMAPGREIRLRYGYIVRCTGFEKNDDGEITEVRCTYDPETRGGNAADGRKIHGTIHWVSAEHSLPAEVHLYDRLFGDPKPDRGKGGEDFKTFLNPDSHTILTDARVEESLGNAERGDRFQFERQGYFFADPLRSADGKLTFNRTVTLRDTWKKRAQRAEPAATAKPAKSRPAAADPPSSSTQKKVVHELTSEQRKIRERLVAPPASLGEDEASLIARDERLVALFDETTALYNGPGAVAKWIVNEVLRVLKDGPLTITGDQLADLVRLTDEGEVSNQVAKEIFDEVVERGGSPREIVDARGLRKITDPESIRAIIETVFSESETQVAEYRAGKDALFGFFVGQVMKRSEGRADAPLVQKLLREMLNSNPS